MVAKDFPARVIPNATEEAAKDIYTFVNYERLAAEAKEKGLHIKEDKGYYEFGALRFFSTAFKDKTKEEIVEILHSIS